MTDLEKSDVGLTSQQTAPVFQREDWSLFRTIDGLQQRAGVSKDLLPRLVLKELADNGLDTGAKVIVRPLPDQGGYVVEDDGTGIDGEPEDIARLFSISRPMVSSKLLRLAMRGALGNGLRVVAGSVLASGGSLVVSTRNRRIGLRPERDGTTTVTNVEAVEFPVGTRVEIRFGPTLPCDQDTLDWAKIACRLARLGTSYLGKSSPWWYDAAQFHELLFASGNRPVRELIANLDGCTGGKAGDIVARAGLERTVCRDVTAPQAVKLLGAARASRRVQPKRLGAVGPHAFPLCAYAISYGVANFGSTSPQAEIPFVVEAWAEKTEGDTYLTACVNRTPATGDLCAARDKRNIDAYGCGLFHTIAKAPSGVQLNIWINVTTPYMPITSDGKAPDLHSFVNKIATAVAKAVRKARRPKGGGAARITQKDVVLDNLDDVLAEVSGDGQYRFNERQVLYRLRPIVQEEIGEDLKEAHFKNIITDYEAEHGEIPGMYREPRGTIYHPHREETITLGTLMVEGYERPPWTFNKLVYIEKEGFSEALKAERWAERHDCALMSSKGFTTRAARDLVDLLAAHNEPVTIFCVHDADAFGTMIHQTFQEETRARGARKVKIINLGLEPWEAIEMGLEVEPVEEKDKRKPVADYIVEQEAEHPCDEDEGDWAEWLQTHRVELNAMTTPQFIAWLDGKMADYDKLIPPPAVFDEELDKHIEEKVRAAITARILRDAGLENQVAATIAAITKPGAAILAEGTRRLFRQEPASEWRDHVEAIARELTDGPSSPPYKATLKFIETFEGTAGALLDWWRSKREERAAMTPEQQDIVGKAYDAKFNRLLEQEPP